MALALIELSCRNFDSYLGERVSELPYDVDLIVFGDRDNAHTAVVEDYIAKSRGSVLKLGGIAFYGKHGSVVDHFACERFFFKVHS